MMNPYSVLDIPENASKEEIKKAYRAKAKQYHPDLHPNDPIAAEKMNEVNQAYDMLQNPEKYASRQSNHTSSYDNKGSRSENYRYQGTAGGQSGYGWSSDFSGFGFDDFFDFAFGGATYTRADIKPKEQTGDSLEIRSAIQYINTERYRDAYGILSGIISAKRDARWNYLFALTYKGMGDDTRAMDFIGRALRQDPGNQTYKTVISLLRNSSQSFYDSGWTGREAPASPFGMMGKVVFGIMIFQLISMMFRMLLLGF